MRGTIDNVNEAVVNDVPDVLFRYSGGQWIFNMATGNLTEEHDLPLPDTRWRMEVTSIFQFGTK